MGRRQGVRALVGHCQTAIETNYQKMRARSAVGVIRYSSHNLSSGYLIEGLSGVSYIEFVLVCEYAGALSEAVVTE